MPALTLIVTFLFSLFSFSAAHAFEARGMDKPASFIVDPATGVYYVSNVAGSPTAKDNNAFIARISADGKLIDKNFIRSGKNGVQLDAPRGLAISGNHLFVADIDAVRRFDKESGKPLGSIDFLLLGVKLLSGLAVDTDGNVYASDRFGNAIYRIDPAQNFQITVVAIDSRLGHPSGLVFEAAHKRLLVAAWGLGKVIAVDLQGNILQVHSRQFKNLDGIDLDREGNIIVSDFTAGEIYRIKKYSTVEVLRRNMVAPAGVSYDFRNNQVLVPSFDGNLVFTFPLQR